MIRRPTSTFPTLLRGLKKRCPRCGRGALFRRWYTLHRACPDCHLELEPLEGNAWFFMYMTTGFLVGLIIVPMLFLRPADEILGRALLLVVWAVAVFGTLPNRKGLALAIDYISELKIYDRENAALSSPDDAPAADRPS